MGFSISIGSNGKGKYSGFVFIPVLIGGGILALWENEGRFDYAKAAADARAIPTSSDARGEEPISLTGPLPPGATLTPQYLEELTGWLEVSATAEIYCWDDESDEDDMLSDLELDWRNYVPDVKENMGVTKWLDSGTARLNRVTVGDTTVERAGLKLIDDDQQLELTGLELNAKAKELGLVIVGDRLCSGARALSDPQLGDERVSYRAVPAASTGTYFGSIRDGKGHPRDFEIELSRISRLIGNDGVLHHLVNGERAEAVRKMKADISGLKWRIRGFGLLAIISGILLALSTVASLLYMIPVLGDLARGASLILSVVVGGTVGLLVILSSALFHHPVALAIPLASLGAVALYLRSLKGKAAGNARRHRARASSATSGSPAHSSRDPFADRDRAALEALVHVAMGDGDLSRRERRVLDQWADAAGIDQDALEHMIETADPEDTTHEPAGREELVDLIELALADGVLSSKEIKL
ncbi:MAG: hypothetical protein ACI8WY_003165, partial [Planctomycetota bacterium]